MVSNRIGYHVYMKLLPSNARTSVKRETADNARVKARSL